jgi:hypothetical protein
MDCFMSSTTDETSARMIPARIRGDVEGAQ